MTASDQVDAAVGVVVEHFGALDIVINNAGIGAAGARGTRAALASSATVPRAAVVNTSSVVAAVGLPNRALYSASEGAVSALTLAMVADQAREGIRVNAVTPGTADTPWAAVGLRKGP